ncbi:MAG: penicillin-binding transpeptidase domain-containing protein, partial [Wujia sp.]
LYSAASIFPRRIQAASQKYFGKDIDKLTISECAALAGITQNPTKYDPVAFPELSAERRMLVLDKMLELDYISKEEYQVAKDDNVYDRIAEQALIQKEQASAYSYYEDQIIDNLVNDFRTIYGCTKAEAENLIYTGGYSVYSVQDMDIQKICDSVINDDSYVSSEKVNLEYQLTITTPNDEVKNYSLNNLLSYYREKTGNSSYGSIYANETDARAAADEYKEYVLTETGGTVVAETYRTTPQPQFSFTIMDQKTGYVKAIVGGKGEKTVDRGLNRATNSPRQPGSTFKILAAYLPIIDLDMGGLAYTYKDEPYEYLNGTPVTNWWGSSYKGYSSFREGISQSMNVLAVKAITEVTPEAAYQYLIDIGLTTLTDGSKPEDVLADGTIMTDITQSAALGGLTYGVTTYEMCAAYAAIANGGVYTKPVVYSKVIDHDGNVVIDNTIPETKVVMKPTTAWQLVDAMRTVVNSGTGTPAKMKYPVDEAGKTGTTSSSYDLWFCGMTPYYTAAIWMGYDYNTRITGNQSIHKTMWRDIMDQIAELEEQNTSEVIMAKPDGLQVVTLCQITNKLPTEGCPTCTDYCAKTAIPTETCGGHESIEYCMDSHKVATENCPNKQTFVIVIEVDEETGEETKTFVDAPEDFEYTEEICDLHPAGPQSMVVTSAGEGGTISPSVECEDGATVTVYITPYEGYSIENVIVNGTSVGAVTSYTFYDVQGEQTISVTFKKNNGGPEVPPVTSQTTTETPTTTEAPPSTEAPTPEPPPDETG